MVLRGLLTEVVDTVSGHDVRNVRHLEGGAKRLVVPDDGLHLHEDDHPEEVALLADRQLQHHGLRAEEVDDGLDTIIEVGAGPVHLVQEAHPRHTVLVRLPPDRLGLRLNTSDAVEAGNSTVKDAKRPLDLEGEIDVAGCVNNVDPVVARVDDRTAAAFLLRIPVARCRCRRDRDATLLLLLHPVHRGAALVHLADLVRLSRVEEDAFGRRGLASINVCHDTNVAVHGKINGTSGGRLGLRHGDGAGARDGGCRTERGRREAVGRRHHDACCCNLVDHLVGRKKHRSARWSVALRYRLPHLGQGECNLQWGIWKSGRPETTRLQAVPVKW